MKNGPRKSKTKTTMTEREILRQQDLNGQRSFYLVLVGKFLHACGNGAFALSRATGYRVRRKQRKWGEVLVVGFPADRLDLVRQQLRDAGGRRVKAVVRMGDSVYAGKRNSLRA